MRSTRPGSASPRAGWRGRALSSAGWWTRPRRGRSLGADRLAGPDRLDVVDDVLAGDPPAAAGPDDLGRGEPVLAEQAANGRGHPGVRVAPGLGRRATVGGGRRPSARPSVRSPGRGARRTRPGRSPARGGGGCWAIVRRAASRAAAAASAGRGRGRRLGRPSERVGRLDDRDLGVVRDRRAFLDEDLGQGALERRRHLGVDLVGDDLEQRLVLVDMVARLLEPLPDRPLGDALAELGHRHLGHGSVPPLGVGQGRRHRA